MLEASDVRRPACLLPGLSGQSSSVGALRLVRVFPRGEGLGGCVAPRRRDSSRNRKTCWPRLIPID